jgi:hypothetical protein
MVFFHHHLFLEISHNVKLNYFLIRKFVFLSIFLEAARYFMLVSNIAMAVGVCSIKSILLRMDFFCSVMSCVFQTLIKVLHLSNYYFPLSRTQIHAHFVLKSVFCLVIFYFLIKTIFHFKLDCLRSSG